MKNSTCGQFELMHVTMDSNGDRFSQWSVKMSNKSLCTIIHFSNVHIFHKVSPTYGNILLLAELWSLQEDNATLKQCIQLYLVICNLFFGGLLGPKQLLSLLTSQESHLISPLYSNPKVTISHNQMSIFLWFKLYTVVYETLIWRMCCCKQPMSGLPFLGKAYCDLWYLSMPQQ